MSRGAWVFRVIGDEVNSAGPDEIRFDVLEPDEHHHAITRNTPLSKLPIDKQSMAQKHRGDLVLLIPGELARQIDLGALPIKGRKARKAAEYLIGESAALELNTAHMALSEPGDNDVLSAVLVQHNIMQAYLSELENIGLTPTHIFRDVDTIEPFAEADVFVVEQRAYLLHLGMVIHRDNLDTFSRALCNEGQWEPREKISIHCFAEGQWEAPCASDSCFFQPIERLTEHWFPARYLPAQSSVNLAQGQYSPNVSWLSAPSLSMLMLSTAACVLLIQTGLFLVAGNHYHLLSEEHQTRQAEMYRTLFPEDRKIINIRAQVKQHLWSMDETRPQTGFAQLFFETLAMVTEAGKEHGASAQYLQYQSNPESLRVELAVNAANHLDQLAQSLAGKGLSASVESIAQSNGKFTGDLTVTQACVEC